MKKLLFFILTFVLVLSSQLFVFAESAPATHTYLISDNGDYVFESVVTMPQYSIYIPIVAMYDSRNALCGLTIGDYAFSEKAQQALSISVTPWNTPKTMKFMLWDASGAPIPVAQYEIIPTTVCNEPFGNIANIQLTRNQSGNYTFEAVFNSPASATYTPVIRMYDSSGKICGFKQFDNISLVANQAVLKDFTVYSNSAPARIAFTLKNGTEVSQYTNITPAVSTEKYGLIMQADSSTGVKLFGTDGTYKYYDFADNFILSYGNTIVTDKAAAYDYLGTLRHKSYNRYSDKDENNKYTKNWTPNYDWLLFFVTSGNDVRFIDVLPTSDTLYYLNKVGTNNANVYKQGECLNNYEKRMARVLISPDGKITSMAFPDDNVYKKLSAGKTYHETFYDAQSKTFGSELVLENDAKIIYIPTKSGFTENDFTTLLPSAIESGTYYIKEYTNIAGQQIVLVTHIVSSQEIAAQNTEVVDYINKTLYGNGTVSLKNNMIGISSGGTQDTNDRANQLAETFRLNIVKCLEDALNNAEHHILSSGYIKSKYSTEISTAKSAFKELLKMDEAYGTSYENAIKNAIIDVVVGGEDTLNWLYLHFV